VVEVRDVIKEVKVPFITIKEVEKPVPVIQVNEIIREVPTEVIQEVEREVPVVRTMELVKEVPKEVFKFVEKIREVPYTQVHEVIREVPKEVVREIQRNVPVIRTKEVVKDVPTEVVRIKEVIKEVPVTQTHEVIRQVPHEIVQEVVKEVPVVQIEEVIKEVPVDVTVIKEVLREVPVVQYHEVVREVPREVVQEVFRDVEVQRRHEVIREVPNEVIIKETVREVDITNRREYTRETGAENASEVVYAEPRTRESFRTVTYDNHVEFADGGTSVVVTDAPRVGRGPGAIARYVSEIDQTELETLRLSGSAVKTQAASNVPEGATHRVASCPQHLSDIHGIGSAFETRLYAANIGTFWEVAVMSEDELARVLKVTDPTRLDVSLADVRGSALRLARETGTLGRVWSGEAPDDFEPYDGIGYHFEKRLYDAGICSHEALAQASVEQLENICTPADVQQRPGFRKPDFQSWINQAKARL
jgi:predicted flap endonuclease-1-like 5' DNA nuclease